MEEVGPQLAKYIAHTGIATRREAAAFVKAGKIKVNDQVVLEPFYIVQASDVVTLNGKLISPIVTNAYFLINKPKDTATTPKEGIIELVSLVAKKTTEKVQSLDELCETDLGLCIVTNDEALIERWQTKRTIKSVYEIELTPFFDNTKKKDLPASIRVLASEDLARIRIETPMSPVDIRKTYTDLGYSVDKMDRIQLGAITKKDLPRGWNRPLTEKEEIFIRHFS